MRKLSLAFTPVLAALALALAAAPASADVITLRSGVLIEGKLVEQRAGEIVFEHRIHGASVRSTFAKADVVSVELTFPRTVAADGAPPTSARYPELRDGGEKVAIVVDRSGSMSIGDRFATAVDEVDRILAEMPAETSFAVYTFDRKPAMLTGGELLRPTEAARAQVRSKLGALGCNITGFTDVALGLSTAINLRPDAIYLLSDGVPTAGEQDAAKIVAKIQTWLNQVRPAKKIPIHVIGLFGGTYELGDPENPDGARLVLKRIAEATGGRYRELAAVPRVRPPLPRKTLPPDERPPDEVTFHFYTSPNFTPASEFFLREFVNIPFWIEIEDPALVRGPVILEYSGNARIELQTFPLASVSPKQYDEKRDMRQLEIHNERQETLNGMNAFERVVLDRGRLRLHQKIQIVRFMDDGKVGPHHFDLSTDEVAYIKLPAEGGTLEVLYKRGTRELKHVFFMKGVYEQGGAVVVSPPAGGSTPSVPPARQPASGSGSPRVPPQPTSGAPSLGGGRRNDP